MECKNWTKKKRNKLSLLTYLHLERMSNSANNCNYLLTTKDENTSPRKKVYASTHIITDQIKIVHECLTSANKEAIVGECFVIVQTIQSHITVNIYYT